MGQIFCDYAVRIGKGKLSTSKGDTVLFLILPILLRVPLELGFWHLIRLARIEANSHTLVWLKLLDDEGAFGL
jgi:hypothetical protein